MLKPEEKQRVFDKIQYTPSDAQRLAHFDPSLVKLIAGGERAGKSRFGGAEVVANSPDASLIWLVGPDYEQAKPEFAYALADFERMGAIDGRVTTPSEGRWHLRLRGGVEIETKTSQEVMRLGGKAPSGILMTEAGQQGFDAFLKLFARTAEGRARGEGWLTLVGTFERAEGWYAELFRAGQSVNNYGLKSFSLPTWSNLGVFPGGRADPTIMAMAAALPPDVFLERFGGEPASNQGVVFPEFRSITHVKPIRFGDVHAATQDETGWIIPNDATLEIWVDPGYAGAYAVLFVCVQGGLVFVMDEIYAKGKTGEQVILEAQARRGLWDRVTGGVMDIAGRQHQAMASQWEVWNRIAGLNLQSRAVPIVDGIVRHQTFLVDPFSMQSRIFHDPKCKWTIWEYGKYRYPQVTDGRDERELPTDANNHAMKAIAYGLVSRFGFVDGNRPRETKRDHIETEMEKLVRLDWERGQNHPDRGWYF